MVSNSLVSDNSCRMCLVLFDSVEFVVVVAAVGVVAVVVVNLHLTRRRTLCYLYLCLYLLTLGYLKSWMKMLVLNYCYYYSFVNCLKTSIKNFDK